MSAFVSPASSSGIEVKFESIHIWIDSQVVLSWIVSKTEHKNLFVRNRIKEIKSNLSNAVFHYVRSEHNPADLITKFKDTTLAECSMGWNGPSLLDDAEQWVTWNSAAHLESSVLVGSVEQVKA